MIAAVFDLDRTLLPGTTAERLFLRDLVRRRVIGVEALMRTVRFVIREGMEDAVQRIRAERPYLAGVNESRLYLEGRHTVREQVWPRISRRGIDQVKHHQDCGHRTVLLSGSLPYVVEPVAERLGIDDVICSQLETFQNRVTGRLRSLHPYGQAKADLVADHAQSTDMDLERSYCYADHHTDIPMLRLFGFPVCVNPSDALRQQAMKCNWQVETYG